MAIRYHIALKVPDCLSVTLLLLRILLNVNNFMIPDRIISRSNYKRKVKCHFVRYMIESTHVVCVYLTVESDFFCY